jgi:hypothetical protein
MTDFHHAHSDAIQRKHFALRFFQNFDRQNGWSGTEIVNSFRHQLSFD